jgi:uncharacterized protein (TIGR03435 family)
VLPPNENREQERFMMRAMLADRLQMHIETRQERIFKLETATGGIKLKGVDPPVPPAKEGSVGAAMQSDGGIRMIANKSTMAGLASALSVVMDRTVVNETGLTAYYAFDVRWRGPGVGQPAETQFGGPGIDRSAHLEPAGPVWVAPCQHHRLGGILGGGPRRAAGR